MKTEEALNTLCKSIDLVQEEVQEEAPPLQTQWGENVPSNSSFLVISSSSLLMHSPLLPTLSLKKKNTPPERKQTCYYLFMQEGPLDTIDSSTSPN